MIALEWADVDLAKRQLCVQRSDWNGQVTMPKGGRLRYVPLTVRLTTALHEHRHFWKDGDKIIVLLGGGTKKRQGSDIAVAPEHWKNYKKRRT